MTLKSDFSKIDHYYRVKWIYQNLFL